MIEQSESLVARKKRFELGSPCHWRAARVSCGALQPLAREECVPRGSWQEGAARGALNRGARINPLMEYKRRTEAFYAFGAKRRIAKVGKAL